MHLPWEVAESFDFLDTGKTPSGTKYPSIKNEGSRVELKLERLDSKIGEDLGWSEIEFVSVKPEEPITIDESVLWKWTIVLPPKQSNQDRFRLVIKEYEMFITESSEYKNISNIPIKNIGTELSEIGRLVYIDTINL